ncbi:MAG: outer membrane beta-barrel protein [bacterium]|nr:outer membrane beta-barrel protein [bacterium]
MQLSQAKKTLLALAGVAAALGCVRVAASADDPPALPTPIGVNGVLSVGTISTSGVNAVGSLDRASGIDEALRTNLTNALITLSKPQGALRFGATVGAYDLPVVGMAGNPTVVKGANTNLFGAAPSWYVEYAPSAAFNVSAGQQLALIGPESTFTYQNVNIQRGLLWNMEPVASRGIRATWAAGRWNSSLEYNDGFYSGDRGAVEGLVGYNTSAATNLSFAFILPDAGTPGNLTSAVANKREYNVMLTTAVGRWSLSPYLLFVDSPSSGALGYAKDERAAGGALLGAYAFNGAWSLGARVEYVKNSSDAADKSPNADLIGYGPGSTAWSYTLTPTYRRGKAFFRAEASSVSVGHLTPGIGFGSAGMQSSQFRGALEAGIQF